MSLALALWIVVIPAADWSWTIVDGPFDSPSETADLRPRLWRPSVLMMAV